MTSPCSTPPTAPRPPPTRHNGRPTIQPAVLRGEALVKRFGSTEALRGLDVEVGRGEILAVMGPSGSGKSTLLHCLAAIVRPDAGRVLYDGARIDDLGKSARTRLRRNAFGFVFQFGQLVPELPAVENVALPLLLDGVKRTEAIGQAAAMFPQLGLEGLEGRRPGEMSGGQAQRVAVAQGPRHAAVRRVRRRAHRVARLAVRRAGHGAADRRRAGLGHGRGPRHPRAADRRLRRPRGRRARRPDRDGLGAVIRLGLRLVVAGGRSSAVVIGLTALAVAFGTSILLFALSFEPALSTRYNHAAWRDTPGELDLATATDGLMLARTDDHWQGRRLVRMDVAALADDAPVPPGLPRVPAAGETFVSPALADLLVTTPADELGDRFGEVVGTIGPAGLMAPDELAAVVGRDAESLRADGARVVTELNGTRPIPVPTNPLIRILVVIALVGALAPVAVFVASATRLSAARREQRLAALRLAGATPAQVTRLAAVEALVATVPGALGGVLLFFVLRPLIAMVPLGPGHVVPGHDRAARVAGDRPAPARPGRGRRGGGRGPAPGHRLAAGRATARNAAVRCGACVSSRWPSRSWCSAMSSAA